MSGKPDPVRAIDTARDYVWLNCDHDDPEFIGLNALVANVFSGDPIAKKNYRPSFVVNHRGEDSHVFDALKLVGIDYQVVNDCEGHADEIWPSDDSTVLDILGAPISMKAG